MTPEELKKQTAPLYVARLVEHDLPGIAAEEQGKAWEEYLEESRKQRRYGRPTPKPTQAARVKVSH